MKRERERGGGERKKGEGEQHAFQRVHKAYT